MRSPFANLRTFVEFWADEKDQHACCLFATDEEIEQEDVFDCDTCPIRQALEGLWPENERAWRLFNQLATRLVADLGIGAEAFRILAADIPADDMPDLLTRLAVIYDVVYPPPKVPDPT